MMFFLKKKFISLVAATAFCFGSALASVTEVPSDSTRKSVDTLSIWVMENGLGSQKALQKIVKKFQKRTGTVVKITVLDWANAFERISKTLSESNNDVESPDVIQLGSTWVAHFAAAGLIRPIDSMMTRVDSSRFFVEAFKNSHIAGNPQIYSIPWFVDIRGLYANERLWFQLGLSDEKISTYPKFIGVLRAVANSGLTNAQNEKVVPYALPGKNDWTGPQQMAPLIWGFGGRFLNQSSKGFRSGLLDSCTLEGLALYAKIMGDNEIAPNSLFENSAQNADRYINSQQLLLYGTSELIRELEFPAESGGLKSSEIAQDGILIVEPPAGPAGRFSFMGGSHLALTQKKDSLKSAAAEDLLAYLVRADNIDSYSRQVGFLPSDKSIIRIWQQDNRYSQLVKNMENGRSFPNIPEWGTIENILVRFSNDMGTVLSKTNDKIVRHKELSKMTLSVHNQINAVLGYSESADEAELLSRIERIFSKKMIEESPKGLSSVANKSPFPWSRTIVAVFALFVLSVVYIAARLYWRARRKRR